MNDNKLILFDIDGVLIRHVSNQYQFGDRIVKAVRNVFKIKPNYMAKRYDGAVEKEIVWDLVKREGINKVEFIKLYPDFLQETLKILKKAGLQEKIYEAIPEALSLVLKLKKLGKYLGLLSGNSRIVAKWKLNNAGMDNIFDFGLFGDEANSRLKLANMVFKKAKGFFGIKFKPQEIVVIGDTIHDIKAGKFIGAKTIAVATGKHYSVHQLKKFNPDLAVNKLSESTVKKFLLK